MNRLDHVAIQVADMDRAIAFYTEKLGLKLLSSKVDEEHHEAFAFLELEGGNLELLQMLDEHNQPLPYDPPQPPPSNCPHVAIAVADLSSQLMLVERGNIPILKEPMEIPGLVRWFYCTDPDSNILEFVQWLSPDSPENS